MEAVSAGQSRYRYRFWRGIGIWSVYTPTISQYRRPAPSAVRRRALTGRGSFRSAFRAEFPSTYLGG